MKVKRNITIKFNTKELTEKLSQLMFHLQEAQKLIDSINSMKGTDLIELKGNGEKKQSSIITGQVDDALTQLLSGRKTINEIRKEFGFPPLNEDQFNEKIIKA